jgi:hypothetical protein
MKYFARNLNVNVLGYQELLHACGITYKEMCYKDQGQEIKVEILITTSKHF